MRLSSKLRMIAPVWRMCLYAKHAADREPRRESRVATAYPHQQRRPHPATAATGGAPRPMAGQIEVEVVARRQASPDSMTFWLAIPGTQRAPMAYRSGQFITLALPNPEQPTKPLYRSYSLCGDGRAETPWEITVKRQEGGRASNYLFYDVWPGMILHASTPLGLFTLPSTLVPGSALIFVATGSGISPIMGMLRALARVAPSLGLRVHLHYAYHSPEDAIYGRALDTLDPQQRWLRQWRYISTEGHRLTVEQVIACAGALAAHAQWYICGSARLRRKLAALLAQAGLPQAQFHAESFSDMRRLSSASLPVPQGLRAGVQVGGRIRLAESGAVVTASGHETILQALEREGYTPSFNCRVGVCGTCRLRLLNGEVTRGEESGLTPEQRARGDVLACVAHPLGDITLAGLATPGDAPARETEAIGKGAVPWIAILGVCALLAGGWYFAHVSPVYFVARLIEIAALGIADFVGLAVSYFMLRTLRLPVRLAVWGVGLLIALVSIALCVRVALQSQPARAVSLTLSNALGILGILIAVYAITQWPTRQTYMLAQQRMGATAARLARDMLLFLREHHKFFGWLVLVAGAAHAVSLLPVLGQFTTAKVVTGALSLTLLALVAGLGEWIAYAVRKRRLSPNVRLIHALLSLGFLLALGLHAFVFPA